MNEAKNDRCRCNTCPGSQCNCGCQKKPEAAASVARACTCGPQCRCGDACRA
jgi:hypothetical protein